MDGPKVCLFQWRIVGFCVPKWRIKVLPTAGEKMLETCKLWSKNHQQYPAKDCLVFLRNHDSWSAGDELVPVRLFGWWLSGHSDTGGSPICVEIVKLTTTSPRNIVTILPTSIDFENHPVLEARASESSNPQHTAGLVAGTVAKSPQSMTHFRVLQDRPEIDPSCHFVDCYSCRWFAYGRFLICI